MIIWYLALISLFSYALGQVSNLTAASVRHVGARLRVNQFIASFFLLGFATSIPEFAVAVFAALRNEPQLSLGNLIGANIVVMTLLIGLTAAFAGHISIHGMLRKNDFLLTLVITALPALVVLNGHVSRLEGLVLLLFSAYFLWLFYQQRHVYRRPRSRAYLPASTVQRDAAVFVGATASLLAISYLLVHISLRAAAALGIPALLIGLLMISLGTNVPEVSFVVGQVKRRHQKDRGIATGILLGNVVFNTPALGLLASLRPFQITDPMTVRVSAVYMLITLLIAGKLMLSGSRLSRREGLLLLGLYALFVIYQAGVVGQALAG